MGLRVIVAGLLGQGALSESRKLLPALRRHYFENGFRTRLHAEQI